MTTNFKTRARWGLVLGLALSATPALAQRGAPRPPPADDRPWAKGVPADKQRVALDLFRDGNAALKDSLFVKAVQKYREALAAWDHPAIHYNLALALVTLDQPVESHDHFVAAMKYGVAPLDSDKYDQAIRYKSLVEKQLAKVDIRCDVAGALVVMDGRPLFTAPGRYQGVVRAGPHSIVASKDGYLTNQLSKSMPPGETSAVELRLFTTEDLTQYRRRWPTWGPWTAVGAGTALVLGGAAMHAGARGAYAKFDEGITGCIDPLTGGCRPGVAVAGAKQQGDTLQTLAVGGYVLGGAALAAGGVLLYLNRLQPYQVAVPGGQAEVTVVPVLTPSFGGAAATVRF